jgi:phage gp16-like protein
MDNNNTPRADLSSRPLFHKEARVINRTVEIESEVPPKLREYFLQSGRHGPRRIKAHRKNNKDAIN